MVSKSTLYGLASRSKYGNREYFDVFEVRTHVGWRSIFGVDILEAPRHAGPRSGCGDRRLFYGRWVRRLSRKVQDALASATEVAEEAVSGIRTVRAFAREDYESNRYAQRVDFSYELAKKRANVNATFWGLGVVRRLWSH